MFHHQIGFDEGRDILLFIGNRHDRVFFSGNTFHQNRLGLIHNNVGLYGKIFHGWGHGRQPQSLESGSPDRRCRFGQFLLRRLDGRRCVPQLGGRGWGQPVRCI